MSIKERRTSVRPGADFGLFALFDIMSSELSSKGCGSAERKFAIDRLQGRMRKRAASASDSSLSSKAVADFVKVNAAVKDISLTLPSNVVAEARHFLTVMIERFTTTLDEENIQEVLDIDHLLSLWSFGPGASNGIKGTHAAEKIYRPMTCTPLCEPLVAVIRRYNPYFKLYDERNGNSGCSVLRGSRLTTVPKNEDTHRTIAIEPSGNMALQLAAGKYLEGVLRYIGLDIRSQQPKNKALASRGSLFNCIATIDLKSASDMFSIDLVRALLPVEWYHLLMRIRSPVITLPTGEDVELNMISTMGNGFTFPLMTLIISSLVYANRRVRGGPTLFIDWTDTCVFGDDIIVPVREYSSLCSILEQAGLIVNHDKSYYDGPFRESCGGDYYKGWDVTPFYVRSLTTDAAIYVAINQVLSWCARQNCILPATLIYLKSLLRGKVHFIPEWMNPDQGVLTSCVRRRYTYLMPVKEPVELKEFDFACMLAVGGYLTPVKAGLFFNPRLNKTRMKVGHSRLPNGYCDGSYPLVRTAQVSSYIGMHTKFLLGNQGLSFV